MAPYPHKQLKIQKSCPLAQLVLSVSLIMLCSAVGGCFLPPPLEIGDPDAGPNSPPIFVSASPAPEFSFPGPMILMRPDERRVSLTLKDNDKDDTLYVRLYVDYNPAAPSPPWAECIAPPPDDGSAVRVVECAVSTLCNPIATNDTSFHTLQGMVADRPYRPEGEPAFRALPADAESTLRSWRMSCEATEE